MDVLDAILTRRSIRRFLRKPVDPKLLKQIVEAGNCAPSAGNRQPWKFIVIENPTLVLLVKRLSPGINSLPACVIAICSETPSHQSRFGAYLATVGCAMAAQNMLLAAHAMDLGACVIRSFSSAGIREILGLPDNLDAELLIALGYSDEVPLVPSKVPLENVVFRDRYGRPW